MRKFLEERLGRDNLEKIRCVKIGIAGCGGLGSNCALNLVRSGFIKLKIVDFDILEASNLNRQFYFLDQVDMPKVDALAINLKRINPEVKIDTIQEKISRTNVREIFADCDIIVEAFDKAEHKSMIVSSLINKVKFIVTASGLAGFGNSDQIRIKKIKKNLALVGDLRTGIDKAPPLSPRVNIAAAKQADLILEYVLKG